VPAYPAGILPARIEFSDDVNPSQTRALLGLCFLAASLAEKPSSAQQGAPLPPPPTKAVRSPGNAVWAATLPEARARASAEKKLVFIEFDQKRCGNCERMDHLLYPAFDFEALLIPMVPVKLDIDSADGKIIAKHYGVDQAPGILVTSPGGRLVFAMSGFLNPEDFYPHIRQDLDDYREFARRVDSQDISKLTAREALETAQKLLQKLDPVAAEPRLVRAASAPDAPAPLRDQAREMLAGVQQQLGNIPAARETIELLIATTRDAQTRERAELFRAQLPLAEQKPAEAYALFRKFQKDHPKSAYRDQVQAMMTRLEASLPK
jgi:thioredoxin-related protein